ncbi:MAG: PIG-L family deacetylase [Saprospiraceae bacterium]
MKKQYGIITLFLLLIGLGSTNAQAPDKPTSADIHEAIKKLNVLGSVLYVAAHPDDENTRMIAYMANEKRMNTAYLSLTRGDGGQNLIGKEIRDLLGVIRTQELLGARSVDGGQQMFTRANDFGYSKTPKETLSIWNKKEVMADVVWAIRKFQPDIIINRFSHDTGRKTHGHHTTSAILSHEAFDLVGDPNVYPEQLKYVKTWKPTRLFFNTSWWFYGSRDKFKKASKKDMLSVDVGVFYPLKGKSNNEIAAESRSMHKCQGFGSKGTRGSQMEYLQYLKGKKTKSDPFDGINTTWTRVEGGKKIGELVTEIDENFRHDNPAASLEKLMTAYQLINELPDGHWKSIKLEEIKTIIKGCLGLFYEVVAEDYSATLGETVELNIEVINRLGGDVFLQKITLPNGQVIKTKENLLTNQKFLFTEKFNIPLDFEYTNAYWLNKEASYGMYTVEDQLLRGLPETPKKTVAQLEFLINGKKVTYETNFVYKRTDPVKGEVYRPFEVTIPVFVNISETVYVFPNEESKTIQVKVIAGQKNLKGKVKLDLPKGWSSEPAFYEVNLAQKTQEAIFEFAVTPPANQNVGQVKAIVDVNGKIYNQELVLIQYDHIPTQTVLRPSMAKIVKIDLKKEGERIGYIMGAGDDIPSSLEQIGYDVTLLEDGDVTASNLKKYDAVILGVRAYNTRERMKFIQPALFEYVEKGGTMIVQYNTGHRLKVDTVAPIPLEISRDRVSMEDAEIRILKPEHVVLNFPNKITQKDFEGWVQERGLYFPNKWDEKYDAILSSNDIGETPKDGGLLVAKHGEGYFIYSGYSWFRELPAGVPGAFRLFTNLISIGKFETP